MHFFYLDEAGCTGAQLNNPQQPIFVLGGISVKDVGWTRTVESMRRILVDFFEQDLPERFELHSHELVNQKGAFEGFSREDCSALVFELLGLLESRKHPVHLVGVDKYKLAEAENGQQHPKIDPSIPYQLCFNYFVNYAEKYTGEKLGRTARSMIIIDEKEIYQSSIDELVEYRRFHVAAARRIKQVVEFSYPIDSVRHPMIQFADLVVFLSKKFFEIEGGYKDGWPQEAKDFYATCFSKIASRMPWRGLIDIAGVEERPSKQLLQQASAFPTRRWKNHYNIG